MDDEGDARLKATYGSNYARLAAVKSKYLEPEEDAELLRRCRQELAITLHDGRPPQNGKPIW
jgi:hypothetical protein